MIRILTISAAVLALAGCSSMPRQTGTSYACNGGTKLNVNYAGTTAIVRVNGMQSLVLKQTPSVGGSVFENKSGARLARNGNEVTWNTAARSAAERCQVVMTPL